MKTCEKIAFETEEEAREELNRIVLSNDWRSWKRKTPSRFYKCEKCFKYHLTSSITVNVSK